MITIMSILITIEYVRVYFSNMSHREKILDYVVIVREASDMAVYIAISALSALLVNLSNYGYGVI